MPLSHPSASTSPGFALRMVAISMTASGLCVSSTAMAQEPTDTGSSTTWGLGLGVVSEQEPYTDIDRENTPIPLLQVENRYIHVFGPQIEFKLPSLDISDSQQLNFGIVGKYDGSGYEEDDAPILDGMSERKGGFWAGAKVEWSSSFVDVSAEWLADVSSNSDGQRFNLDLERTWHFGEHMLITPRVGASWQDEKTTDYYFGVRDSEARIDRPAYAGESAINIEAGVRGVYRFNKHHSVLMGVEVASLAEEIKDSPLVDRSTDNSVFLGYLYRF
ncbi:structural protein MipA [Litchfieldella anticariensis FP35 = DSM 16096]|uniref:Structural protein MipA n=1 Tax=Litchfieldella anticariensis (strain DSM 16096 / CECT 5854 / CIP 108499 / LMG 22089 / FP35) TaxID=1121939 RepID=S2L638_LITA3|nr:MipA/OmpV family protein [Halomonas anticariensis]EPC03219.1 structural protein MipA [Halomonas anticariensis FP35 = DSM 16096]